MATALFASERERFDSKWELDPETGCWLWKGSAPGDGYGVFCTREHGRWVRKAAHRAAWSFYRGPIPATMHVLHRCDRRACVNPDDLFLGTHLDNMADMAAKGRAADMRGDRHPQARLTEADARTILSLRGSGQRQVDIAAEFGVGQAQVSAIWTGRSWSHLEVT